MKLFVFELICAGGLGRSPPPALLREGWAMLAALVEDFGRVPDVETFTSIQPYCPRSLGHVCRRLGPGEEWSGFTDLVSRADLVLVIAPEFDGFLADHCRWVLEAGKPLLGSDLAAIRLTGDKLALARHFMGLGLPTPFTIALADFDGAENKCPFPAVCKPRHGAGSQATFLVSRKEDLARHRAQASKEMPGAELMLQSYVTGQAASITFLIGPRQRLALPPAAQYLSTDGRFHYLGGQLPIAPPLAERAVALGRQAINAVAGLGGLVGVDMVLGEAVDGGDDWIIEINPRPTTSYIGLRQLAQDNLAEALLRIVGGEEIAPLRWRPGNIRFSPFGVE